ncbi:exported hypothetical protein [Candidatus Sulfopaludibacter sp. SbA3]|nr:exported hypothetical protein [Candidatus Sulfopaludibacter sp. SbA3]
MHLALVTLVKLLAAACLLSSIAYADSLNLAPTPGALSANDSVSWGQLGSDGTLIPNPFSATSVGAIGVTGAFSTTTGIRAVGATPGVRRAELLQMGMR